MWCYVNGRDLSGEDAHVYRGNYTAFERLRGEELERQQAMAAKQQAQVAHIQQFVDRFRAKASKAKQVQSRIKALEKMRSQAILHVDSDYRVGFSDPEKVSNPLFSFRNLSLGYGDSTILRNIGQTILPGARIGVLGVNGAGKSTLLKAIVGELRPQAGDFQRGTHAPIGYFAQHQLEALDSSATAFAAMSGLRKDFSEQQCRDGAQTQGVDFSIDDKEKISSALDELGVDYIEGGWPGANPTDTEFFNKDHNFKSANLTAFGILFC